MSTASGSLKMGIVFFGVITRLRMVYSETGARIHASFGTFWLRSYPALCCTAGCQINANTCTSQPTTLPNTSNNNLGNLNNK